MRIQWIKAARCAYRALTQKELRYRVIDEQAHAFFRRISENVACVAFAVDGETVSVYAYAAVIEAQFGIVGNNGHRKIRPVEQIRGTGMKKDGFLLKRAAMLTGMAENVVKTIEINRSQEIKQIMRGGSKMKPGMRGMSKRSRHIGKDSVLLECKLTERRTNELIALLKSKFRHIEVVRGGVVAIESISTSCR